MNNQSAIEAAIAQATAAAGNFVPQDAMPGMMPAVGAQGYGMPAAYNPTPAGPLSVDDMLAGNLDVKAWLKVSKFGMTIGSDPTIFDTIPVTIDFSEIQWCFAVKYGNPARYEKTYDHVTDLKGRPWPQVLQMAQSVDPKAGEFRSADVPFTVRTPLLNKKGEVLVDEGEVIGNSIATTGFKFFQKFIRQAQKMGIDIHNGTVDFDLGFEFQKNDKGEWGVLTYNNLVAA